MQYSSIELKSSKYVLTLVMDPSVSFQQILKDVSDKFRSSARFFRGAQMALEFKGRELSYDQQSEVVNAIVSSCGLDIICVLEETSEDREKAQYNAITGVLKNRQPESSGEKNEAGSGAEETADIFKGTVKNGQKIFSERPVLVLGDVEPLGEVSSSQSIFVAGHAMGTLRAGLDGDLKSYVAALVLKPKNLELCSHKSFTGIRKTAMDDSYPVFPQIAIIEEGKLIVRSLNGKIWSRIFEKNHLIHAKVSSSDTESGKQQQ